MVEAENWEDISNLSNGFHGLIGLLEEYKACVKKFVAEFETEGTSCGSKMPSKKQSTTKDGKQSMSKAIRKKTHNKKSKGTYSKEEVEKVWAELNHYFDSTPFEILDELRPAGTLTDFPNLLNMYAVNRLAAIAKMLQYCSDNNLDPSKFKEGRVCQKIRAWHKMHKITSGGSDGSKDEFCISPYTDHEGICYPLLEELEYLLSLDLDSLPAEIAALKAVLAAPCTKSANETDTEEILRSVSERNQQLISKMKALAAAETKVENDPGTGSEKMETKENIEKEYQSLIPAMKRKREYSLRKERKAERLMTATNSKTGSSIVTVTDQKTACVKSPSRNSETAQEEGGEKSASS